MAVLLECPKCSSTLRIGEAVLGKNVKCPKCQTIFPAKKPEPDVLVEEEIIEEEIIEEDDLDEPGPPKKSKRDGIIQGDLPRSRRGNRYDDEDEDDEDRPRKKRQRYDEDDEEDDDRDDDLDVLDEPDPKKSNRDGIIQGDLPRPRRGNRYDDQEEDDEDRPRKKRQRYDENDEEDDDRPARKRRRNEDEDDYDRPRKKRKKESQKGWYDVNAGISTILTSIYGTIIIWLSTLGLYFMALLLRSGVVVMIITGLCYLSLLGMFGLNVYGHYLNLSPPIRRDVNLKGISLATFICIASSAGSLVLAIVMTIITLASMGSAGGGGFSLGILFGTTALLLILELIVFLGLLAGQVLFLIFLHGICRAFGKKDKAWGVIVFVIASVCLLFGQGLILLLMFSITPNLIVIIILLVMYLGAGLTILIWYIMLLNGVRGVIESGMRGAY